MDERKDIKKKLDDAVAALKTQCTDARFFDSQIDRILSLKGQLDTEAEVVSVKEKDVVSRHKGDTYEIAVTATEAVYRTYGGYAVVASSRNAASCYTTLAGIAGYLENPEAELERVLPHFVESKAEEKGAPLTDEEVEAAREETRKALEADTEARLHVLAAPSWCFCDPVATYEVATTVVETLNVLAENAMKEPLREEDKELNADFEDAVKGAEYIGDLLKKGGEER